MEQLVNGNFVETIAPIFQKYAIEFNLPIAVIGIGQACLESNFGLSELSTEANNILGRKHRDGFEAYYKDTKEYMPEANEEELIVDGYTPLGKGWYRKALPFIHYSSWDECIKDYYWNIAERPAYQEARDALPDMDAVLEAIGKKYASDGSYAEKVRYVIQRHGLYVYA